VTSSIVDHVETSAKTTENVYLMGYEVLDQWILIVWSVLGRGLQSAMRRPVPEIEAIRQIPVGRSEYLPSIPVSIATPLQRLLSGNRQRTRSRQRNLRGMVSYPDDLLRFQARRLAVS
jgi:hypothetical protein